MELVGTIVKSVAWPVVAMLALVLLRKPLAELLTRVSGKLTIPGFGTVTFASRVKTASKQAKAAPTLVKMVGCVPEEGPLIRLAGESPRSAVVEAWRLVESSVDRSDAARGVPAERGRPPFPVEQTRTSQPEGVLDKTTLSIVDNLYSLRNQAVHSDDPSVNAASAREYVQLAMALVQRIHEGTPETP